MIPPDGPEGGAGEAILDVRQPEIIGAAIRADRERVAAAVVCAVDQDTANASGAHFCEGDLLAAWGNGGHGLLKRALRTRATGYK